jgi:hypothetical protein
LSNLTRKKHSSFLSNCGVLNIVAQVFKTPRLALWEGGYELSPELYRFLLTISLRIIQAFSEEDFLEVCIEGRDGSLVTYKIKQALDAVEVFVCTPDTQEALVLRTRRTPLTTIINVVTQLSEVRWSSRSDGSIVTFAAA